VDYQQAIDYILTFADYERLPRSAVVFDLRRVEMLLERLGRPQHTARSVHIAGTKGKGSTAAMISSILTRAGLKTGLYTSPHIHSFTERIKVGEKPIAEAELARLTGMLKPEVAAVNRQGTFGQLTTFEILTALAFVYFRERGVDFQVLETGLGGRLDATNVTRPEVCVLTSISLEHTEVLGDTLAQIATEKAGIIKPGSTVISSPQAPEAMAAIEKTCRRLGVRLIKMGEKVSWQRQAFSPGGQSFELKGLEHSYTLELPLLGEHQMENAAAAVAAVEALNQRGIQVSPESIISGIARVHWPGRLQVLRSQPYFIADGAHNVYSIKRLMEALSDYFEFEQLTLIAGLSADKDISGMVAEMVSLPGSVIATRSRHARAVDPARLAAEFARQGVSATAAANIPSAIKTALNQASPRDIICATGSLFVVAEAIEYFSKTAA